MGRVASDAFPLFSLMESESADIGLIGNIDGGGVSTREGTRRLPPGSLGWLSESGFPTVDHLL